MSTKIRVHELAKETGLDNKEVLRRLRELGIDAKTHSSSVTLGDAAALKEELGKSADQRKAEDEARKAREREELERYKTVTVKAPEKKAAKVLPPHLRGTDADPDAPKAAKVLPPAMREVPTEEPAFETPAEGPAAPAAGATESSAPAHVTETPASDEGDGARRRMPGAPPPKLKPGEAPLRPPAPPRPTPPAIVTGDSPEARRRQDVSMPQEGSGKRSIPAPLRLAPARPQGAPVARGGPGGPGGAPGRGAPRGAPGGSPYRQGGGRGPGGPPGRGGPGASGGPPGRGAPAGPGGPGGPPGRGGPGGPGGAGGPGGPPNRSGPRRKKRRADKQVPEEQALEARRLRDIPLEQQITAERIEVLSGVTLDEIGNKLGVPGSALVKKLFEMGEMATVQQSLPDDTVEILCAELGVDVYFMSEEEFEFGIEEEAAKDLVDRPPVVTVMGHVDHGKTLLLDAIRKTDVVSTEAGGITQHIGAYQIRHDGRPITFIDTPGHAAFTAMRARGAQVTDVVILVVAANDGVMPQTIEAIAHAKAAGVPIVVAINKVDLDSADPDRVKGQLTEHGLVAEDYGGDVPMVPVSAKGGTGLEELLEIVLLQADVLELKANPDKDARGRVVEAHLDKGRGAVATLLVQAGTLRRGDILVAGTADGKIRAMFDENGDDLEDAAPARPVQVLGLNDVPEAGDEFRVVDAERFARDVAERRAERERRRELAEQMRPKTLEDLTKEVAEGDKAVLNVIIKADVSGSAEALQDALSNLKLEEVNVRVIHKAVGAITEYDVNLAKASDAIIVGFNVRPGAKAREAIDQTRVDVRLYRIIYEAIEDIERAVKGLLAPEFAQQVIGEAEVREVFKVPRAGFVFGCMVTDGEVRRDARIRVVREGIVIAEDSIGSLRRFKDNVNEVAQGFECGIGLDKFQDVKVGDVFEAFVTVEVERE